MPAKDRAAYNAYMAEYMTRRYHRWRAEAIAHLGGKCVVCGTVDDLQMDHIDPALKSFNIASRTSSREKFWSEVAKCQVLCAQHHREKTSRERSVEHGGGVSGKRNCYCELCAPLKRAYQAEWRRRNTMLG